MEISHIHREGNMCADRLAHTAHNAQDDYMLLPKPPDYIKQWLYLDNCDMAWGRLVNQNQLFSVFLSCSKKKKSLETKLINIYTLGMRIKKLQQPVRFKNRPGE